MATKTRWCRHCGSNLIWGTDEDTREDCWFDDQARSVCYWNETGVLHEDTDRPPWEGEG
jgi:hypothetical protein